MWLHFLSANLNFIVFVSASLAFMSSAWLYFDSKPKLLSRQSLAALGFFLFSLSLLLSSSKNPLLDTPSAILKLVGQLVILYYLSTQKLQPLPKQTAHLAVLQLFNPVLALASSLLSLAISFFYFRQSTTGLEKHLRPLAWVFALLAAGDLFNSLHRYLASSNSIQIFEFTKTYGYLWMAGTLALAAASIILFRWTYSYLLKQLKTQIFIIINTLITLVFIVAASLFTWLLVGQISQTTLDHLSTNVKVLNYALDTKKSELASESQLLAATDSFRSALLSLDRQALAAEATNFLLARNQASLVVLDSLGTVLARGENSDRIGDSLSSLPALKRAQTSPAPLVSLAVDSSQVQPSVSLTSVLAVFESGKHLGYILLSTPLDAGFIDGLHQTTGLSTSLYAGDILVASSVSPNLIAGGKETDPRVLDTVLKKNQAFASETSLFGLPHLAAYLPITDLDQTPVGMLSAAQPVSRLIELSNNSLNYLHLLIIGCLVLSLYPAYLISRHIESQFS